jgi:hypothetical protein
VRCTAVRGAASVCPYKLCPGQNGARQCRYRPIQALCSNPRLLIQSSHANGCRPAGMAGFGELVPEVRIELTTYPLPRGCATTTLLRPALGRRAAQERGCYILLMAEKERVPRWQSRLNPQLRGSGLPPHCARTSSAGKRGPAPWRRTRGPHRLAGPRNRRPRGLLPARTARADMGHDSGCRSHDSRDTTARSSVLPEESWTRSELEAEHA